MLNKLLLVLVSLATATAATAQTDCARPVVKLLSKNAEIPAAGSAFVPLVTLRVAAAAGCPEQPYRFRNAELTLIRRGRPALPTLVVSQPNVDLRALASSIQPGDQIYVFIAYQNLAVVGADGTPQPYAPPKPSSGAVDIRTPDSKGISFRWQLAPK
ncbi:hypothetical protein [Hymenobacter lucidus]|uniref:Uncharacterized protein n=1 Tax=Hymenobacter lucidus TaxID=2880930 RepID=A0ABS8AP95_9BACT|nr:hypothetical protein [Hymenobacter lucidus]MCB2407924.1 hypothetical protein [Hymenobacter lucidus]